MLRTHIKIYKYYDEQKSIENNMLRIHIKMYEYYDKQKAIENNR